MKHIVSTETKHHTVCNTPAEAGSLVILSSSSDCYACIQTEWRNTINANLRKSMQESIAAE